jgi:hypothetical protein
LAVINVIFEGQLLQAQQKQCLWTLRPRVVIALQQTALL